MCSYGRNLGCVHEGTPLTLTWESDRDEISFSREVWQEKTKGKKQMKYIFIMSVITAISITQGANANFSGGDDFNDNTMDVTKWTIHHQDEGSALTETNGRLESTQTGSGFEPTTVWQWIANSGSYTQDWSITYETVNLLDETSMSNQENWFGMAVHFGIDDNFFTLEHVKGSSGGDSYHHVASEIATDDSWKEDDVSSDVITFLITFDSQTKRLFGAYAEGSNYVTFASYDVSGWGMNDSDVFTFIAMEGGYNLPITSGQVYGDNLQFSSSYESQSVAISQAVKLSFETEVGKIYTIQSNTNLESGVWVDFGDPVIGNGNPKQVFDGANDQQLFYRVLESE